MSDTAPFGPRDIAVTVAMNVLWGLNIIAVKMSVDAVSPMTAAFLRQAIVLLVCAGAIRIIPGRMRPLLIFAALMGGVFFVILNSALAISDNVGALAIATQLGVPFSLLLAVVVLKERIHAPRIFGIVLSILGVVVLVFDPSAAREIPGLLLTALGSAVWALSSLYQRDLKGVPILTVWGWVGLIGVAMLAPVAWIAEPAAMRGIPDLRLGTLGWIAFSAIGSTILGHGSMVWLLQRHPVTTVVPLTLAAPVVSVGAAAWWFGNPVGVAMVVGGVLALLGVAIVTIRTARPMNAA